MHCQHVFMDNFACIRADEVNAQYFSAPSARDDFGETARLAFSDCPIHICLRQREDINIAMFLTRFRLCQTATRDFGLTERRPWHDSIVDCFGERKEDIPQDELRLEIGDVCEEIMPDNIARGIDIFHVRLQLVVNLNAAFDDIHADFLKS